MNYYFDSDNDSDTLSTFLNEFEEDKTTKSSINNEKPTLKQTNPSFISKTKAVTNGPSVLSHRRDRVPEPRSGKVPNNFNVDDEMHKAYNKYKSSIINEKQRKISDNIYAYYNSLNIICGKPGSGKSFLTCRDIIQLSIYQKLVNVMMKLLNLSFI